MNQILTSVFLALFIVVSCVNGAKSDKIKLKDVEVLTLKANRMTTGRRTSPVPQLNCLENCNTKLPNVVQCVNRGFDGSSVQWECKADLEEGYRFGDLAVICEGYDYPDDPYILTGSCGLEYTLSSDGSSYSRPQGQKQDYGWNQNLHKKSKTSGFEFRDIMVFLVVAGIIYALYVTCIARPNVGATGQESTTAGDFPPDDRQQPNMGWNIPGMGSTGFTGGSGANYASCGMPGTGRRRGGAGGFWTGMAAGGLMGYMFGNRGDQRQQGQRYSSGQGTGSSFFGQSQPTQSYSSSSTTRSSTGFAETRRR